MTVYDRLYSVGKRIRWTVIAAVIAFTVGASSTFYWHVQVFGFLLAPAGDLLSPFEGGKPTYSAITDMFGSTLGLSIAGGKLSAFPVLVVGSVSLLRPMTPDSWWRFLVGYSLVSIAMFATGICFVYFVMMPVSLNFLLHFGTEIAIPVILLNNYMELLLSLFKWIGIVFLLPVAMNLAGKSGLLSYRKAKGVWRVALPTVAFFSAIISPGLDGLITVFVGVTMSSLYLVGLGSIWIADPHAGNFLWFWTFRRWGVWLIGRPAAGYYWLQVKMLTHGLWW